MTLSMSLYWKAPDSSALMNGRLKDVCEKGIVTGATLTPVVGSLQIDVSPFTCVTFDGTVARSSATERLGPVVDGDINYVVFRARYVSLGSPIMQLQVMTDAAFLADPEADWLHVIGTIDLTVGGFSDVPAANIFYEERNAVDPQGRGSWRAPVANAAALPIPPGHHNREGDVRLSLDTGSLWWWNDGTTSWEVFDEVPLASHREHEHTNGITGDSNATTFAPTVSGGTDIEIAGVPVGSGYVVNGRYLTTPSGITTITGATLAAVRGLVQVYVDELGAIDEEHRVQLLAEPLDIASARIINISDNHALGNFALAFTNVGGNQLSWGLGEPVAVTTGNTYRLYTADYFGWVDVALVGALPGGVVVDNYQVNASRKSDDDMLIAYYFWDGSGVLTLGTDSRYFGNLGTQELSSDFKRDTLNPLHDDTRGDSLFSGGEMEEIAAPSLNLRIYGPVIAYLDGKRLECGGSYTGITLPDATTRHIYVVESATPGIGTITVSATDPSSVVGLKHVRLGSIVTSGGQITDINDYRTSYNRFTDTVSFEWKEEDNQVRLTGRPTTNSTRDSQLQAGVLHTSTGMVTSENFGQRIKFIDGATTSISGDVTLTNGSTAVVGNGTSFLTELPVGTRFVVTPNGSKLEADSTVNGYGVYRVSAVSSNTSATISSTYQGTTGSEKYLRRIIQLTTSSINDLVLLQPFNTDTSILGAISDGQLAQRAGLGITSGCGLSLGGDSLTVNSGIFIDPYRRIVNTTGSSAIPVDFTGAADGTWVVYWDSSAKVFARVTLITGIAWREDLAFAVVIRAGGTNTVLHDCRMFSGGHDCASYVSVGSDTSPIIEKSNFTDLKAAVVHINTYNTASYAPRHIKVFDNMTTEADFLDFDTDELSGATTTLGGLVIEGARYETSQVKVTWGDVGVAATGPFINNPPLWLTIKNLKWEYVGAANLGNDDLCWVKDARYLTVEGCTWESATGLSYLARWDNGLYMGANTFRDCFMNAGSGQILAASATALFDIVAVGTSDNSLLVDNCSFRHSLSSYDSVFRLRTSTDLVDVHVSNSLLQNFTDGLFNFGGAVGGTFSIQGTRIRPNASTARIAYQDGFVTLTDCTISTVGIRLDGAGAVTGLRTIDGATVTTTSGASRVCLDGCQVEISGNPSFDSVAASTVTITTSATLRPPIKGCRITNSRFEKSNSAGTSVIFEATNVGAMTIANSVVMYSGAGGTLDSCVKVVGAARVVVNGVYADCSSRNIEFLSADFSDPAAATVSVTNCVIDVAAESVINIVRSSLGHFNDQITVSNNTISCEAAAYIFYLHAGGASSSFKSAVFTGNSVLMQENGHLVSLGGAASLVFDNNSFNYTAYTNGPSKLYIGNSVCDRANSLSVCGNTVSCYTDVDTTNSIAVGIAVVDGSYGTQKINNNTISVINNGTGAVEVSIATVSDAGRAVSVAGNNLTILCPDITSSAAHELRISVEGTAADDLLAATIADNTLAAMVASGSATTAGIIDLDYTVASTIAGNTVIVISGDIDLTVTANCTRAIVDGNVLRTGGGTATIVNSATVAGTPVTNLTA